MKRRPYRLGKRADAATATRRRIVEATLTLHDERGIIGTSFRDVAGRAGVSPATVLSHFPRMGDLVEACGRLTNDLYPMPTEAVLLGAGTRVERLRLVAGALFTWWDQLASGWDHLQVDRRSLSEVDAWLRDVDARHRVLLAAALEVDAGHASVAIGTALTSFGSWRSLRDAGMNVGQAAGHVARTLAGSLREGRPPTDSKGRMH
ncbi:MAG: TetR/AcrR family transcriptional regulator [Chloroflexota bacterium]